MPNFNRTDSSLSDISSSWSENHSDRLYVDNSDSPFDDEVSYVTNADLGFDMSLDFLKRDKSFEMGDALKYLIAIRAGRLAQMMDDMVHSVGGDIDSLDFVDQFCERLVYQADLLYSEVCVRSGKDRYFPESFLAKAIIKVGDELPHVEAKVSVSADLLGSEIDEPNRLTEVLAIEIFAQYKLYLADRADLISKNVFGYTNNTEYGFKDHRSEIKFKVTEDESKILQALHLAFSSRGRSTEKSTV